MIRTDEMLRQLVVPIVDEDGKSSKVEDLGIIDLDYKREVEDESSDCADPGQVDIDYQEEI